MLVAKCICKIMNYCGPAYILIYAHLCQPSLGSHCQWIVDFRT